MRPIWGRLSSEDESSVMFWSYQTEPICPGWVLPEFRRVPWWLFRGWLRGQSDAMWAWTPWWSLRKAQLRARHRSQHLLFLWATHSCSWSSREEILLHGVCARKCGTGSGPSSRAFNQISLDFLDALWIRILPDTWGAWTPSCIFGMKAQILENMFWFLGLDHLLMGSLTYSHNFRTELLKIRFKSHFLPHFYEV